MSKKSLIVANFNVVFGFDEKPLLDYFDSIVYPALSKKFKTKLGDCEYKFMNVKILENGDNSLALTGIIVKNTIIEIKSKLDDSGELIETDETYPSAPYSYFVIHLNNHRMTLVKNQKGSPTLSNFAEVFRRMLNSYIVEENKIRVSEDINLLPFALINVVGIPMRESLEETLKKVQKINKLTLRFYPLNGDLDFSDLFEGISSDLRKKVGSKTGSIILNSPESLNGVVEIVSLAQGTIEPTFDVTYSDNSKGKIKNDKISESMEITMTSRENLDSEVLEIIDKTNKIESLKLISKDNQKIYDNNKSKLISLLGKIIS